MDESTFGNAELIAELQRGLRAAGEKLLSESAALAREAGLQAETTMKVVETSGLRIYDAIEEEAVRSSADLIVIGPTGGADFGVCCSEALPKGSFESACDHGTAFASAELAE